VDGRGRPGGDNSVEAVGGDEAAPRTFEHGGQRRFAGIGIAFLVVIVIVSSFVFY
jgi:hypothetical protein